MRLVLGRVLSPGIWEGNILVSRGSGVWEEEHLVWGLGSAAYLSPSPDLKHRRGMKSWAEKGGGLQGRTARGGAAASGRAAAGWAWVLTLGLRTSQVFLGGGARNSFPRC